MVLPFPRIRYVKKFQGAFYNKKKLVTLVVVVRTFFSPVLLLSARRLMKCAEEKTQSRSWDRIYKRLRSPKIDSKEPIPQAYVVWRAGTSDRVVVPARQAGNRFLGSLKGLQIRALYSRDERFKPVFSERDKKQTMIDFRDSTTWTVDLKCREVKTGFCRKS